MNSFGKNFRVSIFGESHGPATGAVIDGVPAGIALSENDFMPDIDRRRSGAKGTTPRRESDIPHILSGVYEGHTTGSPIAIIFHNENTKSSDYELFKEIPRPGHADLTARIKYSGFNDPRGGGHLSGRLTLPIVAAGVVAKKILASRFESISIDAELIQIGGVNCKYGEDGLNKEAMQALENAMHAGDSLGGIVECRAKGIPAGLGEPVFDNMESLISHAVFAIPGVRGVEFGDGFAAASMRGSEHNDPIAADGRPMKNGAGGINGGITNGGPIVFRTALKPTSSISTPQSTANLSTKEICELRTPGRHDACFALRTPVILEAVTAIVLADLSATFSV